MNPISRLRAAPTNVCEPSTSSDSILLTGDFGHPEFRTIQTQLPHAWRESSLAEVVESLRCGRHDPDWIVVFQSRPGQYTSAEVEAIASAAPLAKVIACLGTWNEGETRTGSPWPGFERVYWHQFPHRFAAWLAGRQTSATPQRDACRTWNIADETLARDREWTKEKRHDDASASQGLIAIRALEATTFESYADLCQRLGYAVSWSDSLDVASARMPRGCDLVLWFGDLRCATELNRLRQLRERMDRTPIICAAHFPRGRDMKNAKSHGATTVVSLPCWDDAIRNAIENRLIR